MQVSALKIVLLLLVSMAVYRLGISQTAPEQSVQLITPEMVGEVTLDAEALGNWLQKANEIVLEKTNGLDDARDVVVLVTLNRKDEADFQLGARPPLPAA